MSASLVAGGVLTGVLLAVAAVAVVWTPWDPTAIDIAHRLVGPGRAHPLGTDAFGRDVASLLMAGAPGTLAASLGAVTLGAGLGVPLGVVAAGAGGWVDAAVMRLADVAFAFPALLTAVMLAAIRGPGAAGAALAIGAFAIPVFARVARAASAGVWPRDYVLAARIGGRGPVAIAWAHVLPNIAPVLVVQATIQVALAIVADASLAYVGLGAQPPQPSWGRMLNDAQATLFRAPWLAVLPGFAIALSVLGLNLLGDGLQDRLARRPR